MTIEQIEQMIEDDEVKTNYELKGRFLIAVNILGKYTNDLRINPGHDQVWASVDEDQIEKMSLEDIETMLKCGWFIDEEAWSCFC